MYVGSGTLSVQLLNMRANMIFYFFTGGLSQAVAVGKSSFINVTNVNEPLQGRLSLTADLSQVLVTWTTKNCRTPTLRWGLLSGQYDVLVPAEHTVWYNKSGMCGAPATTVGYRDAGIFHTARFEGLVPGQRIYYQFGDDINGYFMLLQ